MSGQAATAERRRGADLGRPLGGRVAIVTGAGQGVGEGIARRLAAGGATVVIAARRRATGQPVADSIVAAGGSARCIETDVTDRHSVRSCIAETIDHFGALHVMVHNAFSSHGRHRLEDDDWERHWEAMNRTAVWASLYCAQEGSVALHAAGAHGRLILITSPSGIEGSANMPLYSPVKAAQRALAKSLAREWGPSGITVNCVAPVAASPALAHTLDSNPALRQAMEARTPLGRIGDVTTDIGSVALFLASDDAGYVTGQTVVCDGGSFLGL